MKISAFILMALLLYSPLYAKELHWHVATEDRFSLFDGLQGDCLTAVETAISLLPEETDPESFERWYINFVEARDDASPQAPSVFGNRECLQSQSSWDPVSRSYRRSSIHRDSTKVHVSVNMDGTCEWRVGELEPEAGDCRSTILSVPFAETSVEARQDGAFVAEGMVNPERVVIVAFGDSYGSGEGNPDKATLWRPDSVKEGDQTWLLKPGKYIEQDGEPEWLDSLCHRSFWSHQTIAALHVAASRPQARVVYLHYACSGAEIFDGFLVPQWKPPGLPAGTSCMESRAIGPRGRTTTHRRRARCIVPHSQIASAIKDLCDKEPSEIVRFSPGDFDMPQYRTEQFQAHGGVVSLPVCDSVKLPVDMVFLSIGGNDIGFASIIAWAMMPASGRRSMSNFIYQRLFLKEQIICPEGIGESPACRGPNASALLNDLPKGLRILDELLQVGLDVDGSQVIQAGYPDPIRKVNEPGGITDQEAFCGEEVGPANHENEWNTARLMGGLSILHRASQNWEIRVTHSESDVIYRWVAKELREKIRSRNNFVVADEMADAFVGRGYCAEQEGEPPRHQPGVILAASAGDDCACVETRESNRECMSCWQPADWRPYAPMARLVRTMNDSYLTQSSDLRKGAYAGAVHPTAQGQAVLAASLAGKAVSMSERESSEYDDMK